jgi:hypothetical protein
MKTMRHGTRNKKEAIAISIGVPRRDENRASWNEKQKRSNSNINRGS